ncbi:GNAT family N-acetyltransferase [Streptomyces sp. DH10]|uniref:GNAT family N-acetyltransferase n=1 Tax=Streptomyces sp. DH10 TaxID=3040121 RepID=UPI00244230D0|nr:GNAT family N-acetyltransferase [Streptomyces sp. DH10]MDG9711403.1 GNAT family N-acetyltransferase [Streptomyces sp. DH10]
MEAAYGNKIKPLHLLPPPITLRGMQQRSAESPITIRPATLKDAAEICELINKIDVIETGEPETEVAEVVRDMTLAGTQPETDTWLSLDADGTLVGYALVCDSHGTGHIDADHYALPEHQEAGAALLDLMGSRAAAIARNNGQHEAVCHLYLRERSTLNPALLQERGWRPVRRYSLLAKPVAPDTDTLPPVQPGVSVHACASETDLRLAHDLIEKAFTHHFSHHPVTFEQWCQQLATPTSKVDPTLVWLASVEGIGTVGALAAHDNRKTMGWVRQLGVIEDARGHGIGAYLLRTAFTTFAMRSRDTVGLGVDTENTTGALALYEKLGMKPHQAIDTWQLRTRTTDLIVPR